MGKNLKIPGVQVKGINGVGNWLSLSMLYARKDLPIAKYIATPEKISEWGYLKQIKWEIVQYDNSSTGLLNGANCMKASESVQVIASDKW